MCILHVYHVRDRSFYLKSSHIRLTLFKRADLLQLGYPPPCYYFIFYVYFMFIFGIARANRKRSDSSSFLTFKEIDTRPHYSVYSSLFIYSIFVTFLSIPKFYSVVKYTQVHLLLLALCLIFIIRLNNKLFKF